VDDLGQPARAGCGSASVGGAAPVESRCSGQAAAGKVAKPEKKEDSDRITITDPDTGRIFIYDMSEHKLSEYHMDTHTLTPVTDPDDIERVKKLFHDQEEPN